MAKPPPLDWSAYFSSDEIAALGLGIALPELGVSNEVDAARFVAWAGCATCPDHPPPILFAADYRIEDIKRTRELLLHELAHAVGAHYHEFAFAATFALLILRHRERTQASNDFRLSVYDVSEATTTPTETMHFAGLAASHFVDDKRSAFDLVMEFYRIQYQSDRVGLAAAMPRRRRLFFF